MTRASLDWKRARALESRREYYRWLSLPRGDRSHVFYWRAEYRYDRRKYLAAKRGARCAASQSVAS